MLINHVLRAQKTKFIKEFRLWPSLQTQAISLWQPKFATLLLYAIRYYGMLFLTTSFVNFKGKSSETTGNSYWLVSGSEDNLIFPQI